jgi:energy-coupling factor transport system permease protein
MRKFDPRTKLALGIMAIAAVLITRDPVTLIAEFIIVLIAIPLIGPGRKLLRSLRLVWTVLIMVFIIGLIFFDLPTALLLTVRLFTLLSVSFLFFFSIDPQEMGGALRKMGVSYEISFILTTSMRYVPMIGRKVRQISDAQQSRGIDLRPRIKNISNFMALMMPLLVQSFILADELALAMESRGFGCKRRSIRKEYHFTFKEYGVMAISLGLLIALIWWESG